MSDSFLKISFNCFYFPLGFPVWQDFHLVICHLKSVVRFSHNDPLQTPGPLEKEEEENSYILIPQTVLTMGWGEPRKC